MTGMVYCNGRTGTGAHQQQQIEYHHHQIQINPYYLVPSSNTTIPTQKQRQRRQSPFLREAYKQTIMPLFKDIYRRNTENQFTEIFNTRNNDGSLDFEWQVNLVEHDGINWYIYKSLNRKKYPCCVIVLHTAQWIDHLTDD